MIRARTALVSIFRRVPPIRRLLAERDELRRQAARLRTRVQRQERQLRRYERGKHLDYVFVVTYGRSGSTLLQGILGSTPGWLIRGENAGAVYHLYQHYKAITSRHQSRRRGAPRTKADAWYGLDRYPRRRARRAIRDLVVTTLLRPEPGTRVAGFKEIRWQYPDLVEYLQFLRQVFPGARFVFNTRNPDDVVKSKWWERARDPYAQLAKIEQLHSEAREALGDACFHVHYDDYSSDPTALRGLFHWLGEEFDEERVRAVMSVRHSY